MNVRKAGCGCRVWMQSEQSHGQCQGLAAPGAAAPCVCPRAAAVPHSHAQGCLCSSQPHPHKEIPVSHLAGCFQTWKPLKWNANLPRNGERAQPGVNMGRALLSGAKGLPCLALPPKGSVWLCEPGHCLWVLLWLSSCFPACVVTRLATHPFLLPSVSLHSFLPLFILFILKMLVLFSASSFQKLWQQFLWTFII